MSFIRQLRLLVLGETWTLPLGVAAAVIVAAAVRELSGPDGWWHRRRRLRAPAAAARCARRVAVLGPGQVLASAEAKPGRAHYRTPDVYHAVPHTKGEQASNSAIRRHQQAPGAGLIRRFVSRAAIDRGIDLLRLRLDTFPRGRYQPVAALPGRAKRGEGSLSRWAAMSPIIRELACAPRSTSGPARATSRSSSAPMGVTSVALEAAPGNQRTALLAVRRAAWPTWACSRWSFATKPWRWFLRPTAPSFSRSGTTWCATTASSPPATSPRGSGRGPGRSCSSTPARTRCPPPSDLPAMTPDARSWLEHYLSHLPGVRGPAPRHATPPSTPTASPASGTCSR